MSLRLTSLQRLKSVGRMSSHEVWMQAFFKARKRIFCYLSIGTSIPLKEIPNAFNIDCKRQSAERNDRRLVLSAALYQSPHMPSYGVL